MGRGPQGEYPGLCPTAAVAPCTEGCHRTSPRCIRSRSRIAVPLPHVTVLASVFDRGDDTLADPALPCIRCRIAWCSSTLPGGHHAGRKVHGGHAQGDAAPYRAPPNVRGRWGEPRARHGTARRGRGRRLQRAARSGVPRPSRRVIRGVTVTRRRVWLWSTLPHERVDTRPCAQGLLGM